MENSSTCREHLLPDGGTVQSMWCNQSVNLLLHVNYASASDLRRNLSHNHNNILTLPRKLLRKPDMHLVEDCSVGNLHLNKNILLN